MSWAGTVWRLEGQSGVVYVKRARDLEDERDRTVWMAGRLPAPEVLGLFQAFGDDWLVTRAVPGVPLHDTSLGWEPSLVARRLGEILRDIHSVDASSCPFGRPGKGNVLIHGDYCLPNVLVKDGRLSGLIDLSAEPVSAIRKTTWRPGCGRCSTTTAPATRVNSSMHTAGRP